MARQAKQTEAWELQGYLGTSGMVLKALGYDSIPTDHNPVWLALSGLSPFTEEELMELVELGEMTEEEMEVVIEQSDANAVLADELRPLVWRGKTPNKGRIMRAYVLCQTAALNSTGGPIGTGDLGTIRQRWYASKSANAMGFKMAAMALERCLVRTADVVLVPSERAMGKAWKQGAQRVEYKVNWSKEDYKALSDALGRPARVHIWPKDEWSRVYAQMQSGIFADLVRDGLTYEELWVEDVSRKVEVNNPLAPSFYGALLLEKEGLFPHFKGFCAAAGVPILVAMKGNNAFAGVEALLNDHCRHYDGRYKPTAEQPLHLFVISDHDYAGHVPVQAGAVTQFERYLPGAVKLHRVGVTNEQRKDYGLGFYGHVYEFDADHNSAYREWAEEHGIWVGDTCYGIEVEALEPGQYTPYLIDAIVEALGGDEAVRDLLSQMAEPDWWAVKNQLKREANRLSELWKRLEALVEWSEGKRGDVEEPLDSWVEEAVGHEDDDDAWRNRAEVEEAIVKTVSAEAKGVTRENFAAHVSGASKWTSAWRPVSSDQANAVVVSLFNDQFGDEMEEVAEDGDADRWELLDAIKQVFDLLSGHDLTFES